MRCWYVQFYFTWIVGTPKNIVHQITCLLKIWKFFSWYFFDIFLNLSFLFKNRCFEVRLLNETSHLMFLSVSTCCLNLKRFFIFFFYFQFSNFSFKFFIIFLSNFSRRLHSIKKLFSCFQLDFYLSIFYCSCCLHTFWIFIDDINHILFCGGDKKRVFLLTSICFKLTFFYHPNFSTEWTWNWSPNELNFTTARTWMARFRQSRRQAKEFFFFLSLCLYAYHFPLRY
jgi:hypothetical protein